MRAAGPRLQAPAFPSHVGKCHDAAVISVISTLALLRLLCAPVKPSSFLFLGHILNLPTYQVASISLTERTSASLVHLSHLHPPWQKRGSVLAVRMLRAITMPTAAESSI